MDYIGNRLLGVARAFKEGKNPSQACINNNLQGKIDANVPSKYSKNIFCAQNPTELEATCPGDSGKYLSSMKTAKRRNNV